MGQKGTFFKGLSVDVHVHMVTHTIPNPLGITLTAVVVLAVNKVVFVVNGFIFTHPSPTVRAIDIFNILFFHYDSKTKIVI
jgi:hypothetical protein